MDKLIKLAWMADVITRQIMLTLSKAPGNYINQLPMYHSQLVLFYIRFFFAYSLDLSNFLLESGLSYFRIWILYLIQTNKYKIR